MRFPPSRSHRVRLSVVLMVGAMVALLVNLPVPARASPVATAAPAGTSGGIAYVVTWNGVDASSASSASSALSIDLSQTANLVYYYNVIRAGANVTISDARLQMYYLGFAVSTRDQILTNPVPGTGHIPLSWTPVTVAYLLEGVYRLTASFLAPNGTTMWSENFYVRGTAPLGFVALLPIVLLIIVVYEVYELLRSGRHVVLGRKPSGAPPPSAPSGAPPAQPPSSGESSTPPPSSGTSGSSSEAPPPTGGGS